jgi:hypothetical protein
MAFAPACVAQIYTDYGTYNSSDTIAASPNWEGGSIWAVDVNNDGIPDLVQEEFDGSYAGAPTPQFAVSIANGDGTFQPPVGYNLPPGFQSGLPIAFGDFNGDGKVDLAMWGGSQTIAVYLGNGDGTFQSPVYSNVSIAADQTVNTAVRFAVADFNHDGNVDLAIAGLDSGNGTSTVYVLPGNGTGLFSDAIPVTNFGYTDSTHYPMIQSLLVGDYDSDNNADLTVTTASFYASEGTISSMAVDVFYGDGDFSFEGSTPISINGIGAVGSGDLNSDGRSDLFVIAGDLETYYGQTNRTFAAYTQQIPAWDYFNSNLPEALNFPAMADFNDDGQMDIVVEAHDYTNDGFLVFFLAGSDPGQFDYQTWNLQPTAVDDSAIAVGDFNGDGSPDWVNHFYTDNSRGSMPNTTGLNATAHGDWSNCPYPLTARGISLCSPTGSTTGAVNFDATAHSFGQLRKMEVWVDGNKLAEQHNTWGGNAFLNFSTSSLAPGAHQGTIFAADIDNTLQRYDFNFNVGPSSCAAPTSNGVNICSPANGSNTSGNAVQVQATANVQGTLARMEIWVDSVKDYSETDSSSLATTLNIRAGSHVITVFAANTDGTLWKQAVTVTVP